MSGQKNNDNEKTAAAPKFHERFPLSYRVQHIILILTFLTLILTGLPLLFPESRILHSIFFIPSLFVLRGTIHRAAAIVLVSLGAFHLLFVIFSRQGNDDVREILPGPGDLRKALQSVRFNFGLTKQPPEYGRFRIIEKFQYLAVGASSCLMVATGGILWFKELSLMLLPKWVLDIAITIHGLEAILIFVALIVWHLYTVHFSEGNFLVNRVWLDGKISEEKLEKLYPLEYKKIKETQK